MTDDYEDDDDYNLKERDLDFETIGDLSPRKFLQLLRFATKVVRDTWYDLEEKDPRPKR